MKNYFKATLKITKALSVLSCAVFVFVACTDVDDTLGLNLIPGDQQMHVAISDVDGIETYVTRNDSMRANRLGIVLVGNKESALYGKTKASALLQFLPASFKNEDHYGFEPYLDSLILHLAISGVTGDSLREQTFDVYQVVKPIAIDSIYYPDFDIAAVTNLSDKLFSFKYKGGIISDTKIKFNVHNDMTAAGVEFFDKVINANKEVYEYDSTFLNKFNGFYFVPSQASPEDAALYTLTLSSTYMTFKAYNKDKENPTENKDTLIVNYYFDDGQYYYNTSINVLKHDYTGTPVGEALNASGELTKTSSVAYVEGPVGVQTTLKFTDGLLDQITALKTVVNNSPEDKHKSGVYRNLMINKALMIIKLQDTGVPYLDAAPSRLGMYYNLPKFTPIPDYAYSYESSSSYALPYGGYLNRTQGEYTMDITTYLQRLISDTTTPRDVVLAQTPQWTDIYGSREIALQGTGSANPIKIQLTYTLIK